MEEGVGVRPIFLADIPDKVLKGAAKRDRADNDGRVNDQVPVKARGVHFQLKTSAACNVFTSLHLITPKLTSTKVLMEMMEQCSRGEVGIGGICLSKKNYL